MIVSFHGRRGGTSPSQSNERSTTTDLGIASGVVLVVGLEVGVGRVVGRVGQHVGRVPVDAALDRLGVGIDEQLDRVEAVALLGRVAAVDAVAVALAGADARQVAVPVVGRALDHVDALLGRRPRRTGTARRARRARRRARSSCPRRPTSRPAGTALPGHVWLAIAHRAISAPARAGRRTPPWPSVALCVASATVRPSTGTVRGRRREVARQLEGAAAHAQPAVVLGELDAVHAGAAARGARAAARRTARAASCSRGA